MIHVKYNKFNLIDNVNRNFDFGASNLSHNPITNPTNNLDYNKYLNFNVINQGNQTSPFRKALCQPHSSTVSKGSKILTSATALSSMRFYD